MRIAVLLAAALALSGCNKTAIAIEAAAQAVHWIATAEGKEPAPNPDKNDNP